MSFENKRILLICREVYSFPFYFLVDKWKEKNEVAAFFFSPSETKYKSNPSNSLSYYAYKKHKDIKLYTTDDISDEFTAILSSDKIIDDKYLGYIENEYTHYLNINQQVLSTQSLTRHYHYRNFWAKCNYAQQINWIILNYRKAEQVLEDFKPDVLLDCDNAELGRCVLREICYKRNIPYIFMDYPRFETYKTFSFNLGFKVNEYFKQSYINYLSRTDEDLKEELAYVDDFRKRKEIMHFMYKNDATSKYKPDGIIKSMGILYNVAKLLFKQDFIAGNYNLKSKNPLLYPSSYEYLKFFVKVQARKEYLMRRNRYFSEPREDEKYVYMPLHLIPESTTFTLAPMYINELNIIEAVSKSLPAGWFLYVKEHQAMVGERPIEFYKSVNKLPNVKMVQLNYYHDPLPWITKSMGVITISGTTAFEAALLGKNAAVFSDVPFSLISTVTRVKSFEDLPSIIKSFENPIDNRKSCASYIAAVKEFGYPVNIKYIIEKYSQYYERNSIVDEELKKNIDNLDKLFFKGYDCYLSKSF